MRRADWTSSSPWSTPILRARMFAASRFRGERRANVGATEGGSETICRRSSLAKRARRRVDNRIASSNNGQHFNSTARDSYVVLAFVQSHPKRRSEDCLQGSAEYFGEHTPTLPETERGAQHPSCEVDGIDPNIEIAKCGSFSRTRREAATLKRSGGFPERLQRFPPDDHKLKIRSQGLSNADSKRFCR